MRRAFSSRFTLPRVVRGLCAAGALLGSLGVLAAGCSLGNLAHDDCTTDAQCSAAFGVGSVCSEGYCSDAATCTTGHDCRKAAGGGACVTGACQAQAPEDSACKALIEPPDLLSGSLVGEKPPVIIGGIFSLDEPKNAALTVAIRLGVKDINRKGGMDGNKLGIVFCDNGGTGNTATGEDRIARNNHAVDYLAGTLGVPVILGPLTSSDAIQLITHVKEKSYPTVIISPSATSPDLTGVDDRLHPDDKYGLFWRTCPSDLIQGKVLAEKVIPPMSGDIAVIYLQDAYGEGLATVFRKTYGLKESDSFPLEEADLSNATKLTAVVDKVTAYAPKGIVVITTIGADAIKVVTALAAVPALVATPFYFTDGAKDATALLNPALSADVKAIIQGAKGTAPASPSGTSYETLKANLTKEDMALDPSSFSFLAQSYDATLVGAYGIIAASKSGPAYDGLNVAAGLAHLSAGKTINLDPTEWLSGVGELRSAGQINVAGISGPLDFDPVTGEAPAQIEIWKAAADFKSFESLDTVDP